MVQRTNHESQAPAMSRPPFTYSPKDRKPPRVEIDDFSALDKDAIGPLFTGGWREALVIAAIALVFIVVLAVL